MSQAASNGTTGHDSRHSAECIRHVLRTTAAKKCPAMECVLQETPECITRLVSDKCLAFAHPSTVVQTALWPTTDCRMGLRSWDLQSIVDSWFVNCNGLVPGHTFYTGRAVLPSYQAQRLFFGDEMPPFQINRGPCYRIQSKKAMTNENTWNSLPSWSCFVIS